MHKLSNRLKVVLSPTELTLNETPLSDKYLQIEPEAIILPSVVDTKQLRKKIMDKGNLIEPEGISIIHGLGKFQVVSILETLRYFESDSNFWKQSRFYLILPKYRIFDWLAMCLDGRWKVLEEPSKKRKALICLFSLIYLQERVQCPADFVNELRWRDLEPAMYGIDFDSLSFV